mmetsp:Transcript_19598/g.65861  ORF Transcript_19598/g.65861 Transcript_19598/m.65861 type:complete len:205 (+) Transcript_19598:1675-2289(+)
MLTVCLMQRTWTRRPNPGEGRPLKALSEASGAVTDASSPCTRPRCPGMAHSARGPSVGLGLGPLPESAHLLPSPPREPVRVEAKGGEHQGPQRDGQLAASGQEGPEQVAMPDKAGDEEGAAEEPVGAQGAGHVAQCEEEGGELLDEEEAEGVRDVVPEHVPHEPRVGQVVDPAGEQLHLLPVAHGAQEEVQEAEGEEEGAREAR